MYDAAYILSAASVVAVIASVAFHARKAGVSLGPGRILGLTRDEASRLSSGDPVFLMHVSIAGGVGLSIGIALLDPLLPFVEPLRLVALVATVPLLLGLAAAFGWRVKRYAESRRVDREIVPADRAFSRASSWLQSVLMLAIALTSTELVLAWFPAYSSADFAVDVARNAIIAVYYGGPTANLVGGFDRALPSVRVPFKLADLLSGSADISTLAVGVSKTSQFAPDEALSYDSCVEIGACESACPATAAGRPLSPRALVRKVSLLASKGGDSDPFEAVADEELWSCTSCGACVSSCPVSVKHLDIVYDLRRSAVGAGRLDKEKAALLQNLAQSQNPYGFSPSARADWAKELGVRTAAEDPGAEYLYWVGCAASYDQRAQGVARSMVKIMKKAGVSFAILGGEEACNGDPARRLGEEGRYQELAYQNIEKMNSRGVKKVVTTCPHCFNVLKNEYPTFGGNYQVVHHTQLISDLVREGRLELPKGSVEEVSTTLHDACYASRYNSIFDEPREALAAAGASLHEMKRRGEKTFCCGAGGSNYWYKVSQRRSIASIRAEEAKGTGAKTVATECPFCLSMLEDAARVADYGMGVRDVAEILADRL